MEYTKTCTVCGNSFTTDKADKKCCSSECGLLAGREASRKRRKYYNCQYCGKPFWKPNGYRIKYCSKDCQHAARKAGAKPKIIAPPKVFHRTCEWCGREFDTVYPNQKYCCHECGYNGNLRDHRNQWASEFVPRKIICKECGTEFTTECGNTHSVFCCQSCADKYERRVEHKTQRHKKYTKEQKQKRKKQIKDGFVEEINYNTLFERDHGLCQICGLPVMAKGSDDSWEGTIDHIIPLSLGGEHSYANCQLTHRVCNSLKCQNTKQYHIDWEKKSAENNYWREKYKSLITQTRQGQ